MPDYTVYGYYWDAEKGCHIITKNGDHLLTCIGGEAAAKNIVKILNEDARRKE